MTNPPSFDPQSPVPHGQWTPPVPSSNGRWATAAPFQRPSNATGSSSQTPPTEAKAPRSSRRLLWGGLGAVGAVVVVAAVIGGSLLLRNGGDSSTGQARELATSYLAISNDEEFEAWSAENVSEGEQIFFNGNMRDSDFLRPDSGVDAEYMLPRDNFYVSLDDLTFSVGDVLNITDMDEEMLGFGEPIGVEDVASSLHVGDSGPCITDETVASIMRASYVDQDGNEVGAFYAVKVDGRYMYFGHDNGPGLAYYIDSEAPSGMQAGNCS